MNNFSEEALQTQKHSQHAVSCHCSIIYSKGFRVNNETILCKTLEPPLFLSIFCFKTKQTFLLFSKSS